MKNTSHSKRWLSFGKLATVGMLIVLATMAFSACEAITNSDGDPAVVSSALSVNGSRVGVKQTVINNEDELKAIEGDPTDDYMLGASFSVSNWVPICGPYTGIDPFTGSLDGDGFTITIESFDRGAVSGSQYLGIFQQSEAGAGFSNLTVNVAAGIVGPTAASYVGGLVGQATVTTFTGITVTGTLDVVSSNSNGGTLNTGLIAGFAGKDSEFEKPIITANLNVLYDGPATGVVNAGGAAGYLENSDVTGAFVNGKFVASATMPYTYSTTNGVKLGSVAGYAENGSTFTTITVDASTAVDAQTTNNPVYVGGVLGNGLNVTITDNVSDATVSGNGPGYNTSAGGVAGYIVSSTVTDSSATGDVTLGATWVSTGSDAWQVYAGGLVGYAGGAQYSSSLVDHSHASGNVSAIAPYPYAGGLVGYLYGYNDFTSDEAALRYYRYHDTKGVTVTYSGGKITRSYATGSVSAAATTGSGGLPYAGGLAAYSSIPTTDRSPNIENCYATGSVTATSDGQYAWGGGLLGSNAQGSIVATSYATGAVSVTTGVKPLPYGQPGINPGAAGGGIVGVNYYIDVSSNRAPLVTHSVALNPIILGSSQDTSLSPYLLHRVAGDLGDPNQPYGLGILDDNDANSAMIIAPVWNSDIGPDDLDGASVAAQPDQTLYTGLGWDFSGIWVMGANGYPALR
jgi:hypothetical protein